MVEPASAHAPPTFSHESTVHTEGVEQLNAPGASVSAAGNTPAGTEPPSDHAEPLKVANRFPEMASHAVGDWQVTIGLPPAVLGKTGVGDDHAGVVLPPATGAVLKTAAAAMATKAEVKESFLEAFIRNPPDRILQYDVTISQRSGRGE
jgi:hypothetical protein